MTEYVIETENLCKLGNSGNYRVKDLNLRVPKACVYGFLGPNGAGKTTTMKMLLSLIKPTSGKISILSQEVTNKNKLEINRHTGSIIESPAWYGHLTGMENLEIVAGYKGIRGKEAEKVMRTVGLYERRHQKTKQYSFGMKQRLGLAMALIGSPEILILDEPTNGLDPAGIQEIRELIKSLPILFDTTVLVSSHLLSEIDQMADYVGIINNGELAFQGELNELENQGDSLENVFLSMTDGNKL